jgi:hypothetical protein
MKIGSRKSKIGNAFTIVELLVACQPTCPSKLGERSGKPWRRPIQSKFTLIELLVVIGIISIKLFLKNMEAVMSGTHGSAGKK